MITATLSTSEGYSSWNLAWRMSPKWRSRKPALTVSWLVRIQGISRCPMCITPMAPLMKRWICRSRIGSKSFCSFRPATSVRKPRGITPPPPAGSRARPLAPRRRGVLLLVHLAQGQDKGEDALLVIEEDLPRLVHVARDEAAERHRRAGGDAEGETGRAPRPARRPGRAATVAPWGQALGGSGRCAAARAPPPASSP